MIANDRQETTLGRELIEAPLTFIALVVFVAGVIAVAGAFA